MSGTIMIAPHRRNDTVRDVPQNVGVWYAQESIAHGKTW